MLAIHSILATGTMRRSVTGALATDPTLSEPRRRLRRPVRARRTQDRARAVRTPVTAPQR